jgi:hypothetical protein
VTWKPLKFWKHCFRWLQGHWRKFCHWKAWLCPEDSSPTTSSHYCCLVCKEKCPLFHVECILYSENYCC